MATLLDWREIWQANKELSIVDLIRDWFPERPDDALRVVAGESSFLPDALNAYVDRSGTPWVVVGLFQISERHIDWLGPEAPPDLPVERPGDLLDPETNVCAARLLYDDNGGKFSPVWATAVKQGIA